MGKDNILDPIKEAAREVRSYHDTEDIEEWSVKAACNNADPELFFSADGERASSAERRFREAKSRYCVSCLVRVACLSYAIENGEEFGVWGGLDESERRLLARRISRKPVA